MTYPVVARGPLSIDVLLWVSARNRATGVVEEVGLWTGHDVEALTVDGQSRTYYGAGAVLSVSDIVSRIGTNVQMQSAQLNVLTPEVEQMILGYDARQAPVEVHLRRVDPETGAELDITRCFKGFLEAAPVKVGPKGGASVLEATLASTARMLTRRVAVRRSDASQQRAHPGDRFFRHAAVSGVVPVWWGQVKNDSDA
jgi:hypothetical protein